MSLRLLRLTALATGMAGIGLIAGAAIAAPEEMAPLARALGTAALEGSHGAWVSVTGWATTLAAPAADGRALSLRDRSPRQLAMLIAATLTIGFGLAALVSHRRRTPQRAPGRPVRFATRLRDATGGGLRLPASAILPLGTAPMRRRGNGEVPRHVHALAAKGVDVAEIARRTGLPLDAVSLLLALSPEARQAPPSPV